jgi:hypothetical protein
MSSSTELNDIWSFEDGRMIARGDADAIDDMLATKLNKIRTEEGGWTIIYRHRTTGQLWELRYPKSEMHGGGPRRLRLLAEGP